MSKRRNWRSRVSKTFGEWMKPADQWGLQLCVLYVPCIKTKHTNFTFSLVPQLRHWCHVKKLLHLLWRQKFSKKNENSCLFSNLPSVIGTLKPWITVATTQQHSHFDQCQHDAWDGCVIVCRVSWEIHRGIKFVPSSSPGFISHKLICSPKKSGILTHCH